MIQKWSDYDKVKGYTDFERLPKGGYVVKILGVSVGQNRDFQQYLNIRPTPTRISGGCAT